jgi:tRNA A-37 threonylcarbamoyl transferase component Bud32
MKISHLKNLSYTDLKEIAEDMDIKISKNKDELIKSMLRCFKEWEKYKKEKIDKYEKIKQLGNKGKEGITYLVVTKDGNEYAMKTFKKNKSSDFLKKEAYLQELASKFNIAPKIIEIDTVKKTIVMEKMDKHLFEVIKYQEGDLTEKQQKDIINIFKNLDKAKVFHADSNILNYMYKGKKLCIIDFGMSKYIDDKLTEKLGTETPNIDLMTLGFILKLKELNCKKTSYSYLLKYVSDKNIITFNLV